MPTPITQQRPSAEEVARCIVKIAHNEQQRVEEEAGNDPQKHEIMREGITPLKLQKLLYFAQAASLVLRKQPLFDDDIQAWELGPVVYSVYKKFENYQGNIIPVSEGRCENIDGDTEEFLKKVWNTFGKYSAIQLVEMTHRHNPWKDVFEPNRRNKVIPIEKLEAFYAPMFDTTHAQQSVTHQ